MYQVTKYRTINDCKKVHINIRAMFHKNSVVIELFPQTIKKNSIDFVM